MSSTVRFISDLHLGHKNMALRRGFKDADEMNDYIIHCWNTVVNKRDVTYILGDITMEKENHYHLLDKLNGHIKVILGNHDRPQYIRSLLQYVVSVASVKFIRDSEYGNVILTHIPIHESQLDERFGLNIHGHIHEKVLEDKRYINVSAEVIDYTPQTLKQLIYNGVRR